MSYNPGDVEVLMGRNNSPLCPPQPWTGPITFLSVCNTVYIPKIAQEATVRTGHGTTGWFQIGKGVHQGCILSPCLFNLYAEYIMKNDGLEEAQVGIKTAGRNTNSLRYADDTTLMAESEEELKSLFRRVKEE